MAEELKNSKIFYATAFFLTSNSNALFNMLDKWNQRITAIGKHNNQHHGYFALNLSATFLIDQYQKEFHELIPKCDFLFGNEDEYMHLAKALNIVKQEELEDTEECFMGICKKIHEKFHKSDSKKQPSHIIVTRGSKPLILSSV